MDLNCDLGESLGAWRLGDDEAMLDVVTSANIACGFHAGDSLTLRATCAAAARRGVVVGAQVGYRDLVGFGRRFIDMDAAELTADVLYQLGALEAFCRVAGTRVRYVKPHGALYHATVDDEGQARAVVTAVQEYDAGLAVLGLPGSRLLQLAEHAGLRAVPEAFADRAYRPDGTLVPRGQPGAVLDDPRLVAERMLRLSTHGQVETASGSTIAVDAVSICVHGDTPSAAAMAHAVREALQSNGIQLQPFITGELGADPSAW